MSFAAVQKHVGVLERAGLVTKVRRGREQLVHTDRDAVSRARRVLDELNPLVHPIAVGDGLARLFPPDEPAIALELLSSQTFKSGVLNLSYAPAKA
jgi:hypothetical protein